MAGLADFHQMLGQTIMYCQCIEHDIKMIYAGMKEGDYKENLAFVEREGLGPTLRLLEEVDHAQLRPFFTRDDYRLLNQVRKIRNHWVHESYTEFLYLMGKECEEAYKKEFARLRDENAKLLSLHKNVEKVRLDVMRVYKR